MSAAPVATVEVFCAVVPDVERFTLAGSNLVSGNCPYAQTYIAQELRWKVGAYGNKVRRRKTVDTNVSIGPCRSCPRWQGWQPPPAPQKR